MIWVVGFLNLIFQNLSLLSFLRTTFFGTVTSLSCMFCFVFFFNSMFCAMFYRLLHHAFVIFCHVIRQISNAPDVGWHHVLFFFVRLNSEAFDMISLWFGFICVIQEEILFSSSFASERLGAIKSHSFLFSSHLNESAFMETCLLRSELLTSDMLY